MAIKQKLMDLLDAELENLNLFLPFLFALGIAFYFSLSNEPNIYIAPIVLSVLSVGLIVFKKYFYLVLPFIFFVGGFLTIQIRTHLVAEPVLSYRHYNIELSGTVDKIELKKTGMRLTLDNMTYVNLDKDNRPTKIRFTTKDFISDLSVGDKISARVNLMPPMLPVTDNGYPFVRKMWFEKLGAIGYTTQPVRIIQKEHRILAHPFEEIRLKISERLKKILPQNQYELALPLITGEQNVASDKIFDTFRDAGIIHVLSVSGFHMTLIAGFVFFILRSFLALFPSISLRIDTKKLSALLSIIIVFIYLLISGMAVPAVRSFLMIFFVLLAVLLDRQALSMRSVCWGGFLILLCYPESLMTASFQLSFCAVMALIAGYEKFKQPLQTFVYRRKNRLVRFVLAIFLGFLLTNIIAHFVTAPIAAFHFHRYATYGVLGNFLTSTLFGVVIMPLLLIGTILMPFGLDAFAFHLAGHCLDIVCILANFVSELPYASLQTKGFTNLGLFLILFGIGLCCILKSKIRLIGFVFIFAGLGSSFYIQRPDVLISQGGKLYAVRTDEHKMSFSSLKKEKFTRQLWMENLSLSDDKIDSFAEPVATIQNVRISFDPAYCDNIDISFSKNKSTPPCPNAQYRFGYRDLWKDGTHAVYIRNGKITIKTARESLGHRPWNPRYKKSPKN